MNGYMKMITRIKIIIGASCVLLASLIAQPISSHAFTNPDTPEIKSDYLKNEEHRANIFIGDSRTALLDYYLDLSKYPDTFVIAKSGMGYDWLISEAIPELEKIQASNDYSDYNIIFNLGVNDLKRIDDYLAIIPTLEKYGTLYYVSVNPVDDSLSEVTTAEIESFNKMIDNSADRFINSYEFLSETGFSAPDGLHFDELTSKKIHDYTMLAVSTWEYLDENSSAPVTEEMVATVLNNQ